MTETLDDGAAHYFHVRAIDSSGRWSDDFETYGPMRIDTVAPEKPASVTCQYTGSSGVWPFMTWHYEFDCADVTDTTSGVKQYDLQYRYEYAYVWCDPILATNTARPRQFDYTADTLVHPQVEVRFRVIDWAENSSGWSVWVRCD